MLAIPGRAEQAREFTQLGSMWRDQLGRVASALFRPGAIISGCTAVIQGQKVIVSSGQIYLDGLVRNVDGSTVAIEGIGNEVIGAKIVEDIVTEIEDPSLRDPAQEAENSGQSGAHRIRETVEFVVNDDTAATLYTLEDGELLTDHSSETTDIMTDILARRTFDENGNYKVSGLQLTKRDEVVDGKIIVGVTEGKAYIMGYEINKPFATRVRLDYAQDVRRVFNEPKVFNQSILRYKLNNYPVKQLDQVKVIIEITETITRGNIAGGIDYLSHTPVVNIMEVKQSTTYTQGTDYQLINDGVDWSLPGNDPAIGSTYQVKYRYNRIMVLGEDIQLTEDDGVNYVEFINPGVLPVTNTSMDVSYTFYLSRIDTICMNDIGDYFIIKGRPDVERNVQAPINGDYRLLALGHVLVYPNTSQIKIVNYKTERLSQQDLYLLSNRVDSMEFNQAISDLDREAIDGEAPTGLKGIYTDGFIGTTKCDLGHPDFRSTINIDNSTLGLPEISSVSTTSPNSSTVETNVSNIGRVLLCPYTHERVLSQPFATGHMLVNPYAAYDPLSIVNLNPAVDNWIDTDVVTINNTQTITRTVASSMRSYYANQPNQETSSTERIYFDSVIEYMRSQTVKVVGANFTPFENNVYCTFNGIKVPLSPAGSTQAGTDMGTVRVDGKGRFEASFVVPPSQPCGSVEVKLYGNTSSGSAIYSAQGHKQILERTVLTTNYKYNFYSVDPLAQSFMFNNETILTQVGLYFSVKDDEKEIVVQVRSMNNGFPGQEIHAEVAVHPDDIRISNDGSEETIVKFDQPVYCSANTFYCFTILSDSNKYQMLIAELGKKDIRTENFVTSQPYAAGVLFSSSNASTWTEHQTVDLKFNLYRAKFVADGEIVFNNVPLNAMTKLILAASTIDYRNQGIEWYYKVGAEGSWVGLELFTDVDLGQQVTSVTVKAVLKASDTMSPMVAADCVNLVALSVEPTGAYVSRQVEMDEFFNTVKVYLNLALPSGTVCNVFVQCADDPNNAGWQELTDPTIIPISESFSRYEWTKGGFLAKKYRVKVLLSTVNPVIRPYAQRLMSILRMV